MVRELYENAVRGIDTRQNLSALRSAVKDDAGMNDLFELVEDDLGTMTGFLDSRSEEHTSELQSQWSSRMPSSA